MVDKRSWKEFRESGLLWFINKSLQVFGWKIVFETESDNVVNVYPVRTREYTDIGLFKMAYYWNMYNQANKSDTILNKAQKDKVSQ